MEPSDLSLYKCRFKKIRIGNPNDGGYVICEIPNINYDTLLSCGIADNITFEEHLCSIHQNMKCYAFDGTIQNISYKHQNIEFIKKNIGIVNDDFNTNLKYLFENNNNIFLKMDIEGYELEWFNFMSSLDLDKIVQMVIEFHSPFNEKTNNIFKKINNTHLLVHFHPNNCVGMTNYKNVIFPDAFECTYVNKKYILEKYELNSEIIPTPIDNPNSPKYIDRIINYPPFVNKIYYFNNIK